MDHIEPWHRRLLFLRYCFKSSKLNWPKKKNTFLMRPPFQRDNIVCPWCKKQVGAGAPSTWNIKKKKHTNRWNSVIYLKKKKEKAKTNSLFSLLQQRNPTNSNRFSVFKCLHIQFWSICPFLMSQIAPMYRPHSALPRSPLWFYPLPSSVFF